MNPACSAAPHAESKRPREAHPRAARPQDIVATFAAHWPLYAMEAAELGLFMLSACVFDVLLFGAHSPVAARSAVLRRLLMGVAMGVTAIGIIRSPLGRRSGGQFNPAVSITFYRLGKLPPEDTLFYIIFQFIGGIGGVGVAALLMGNALSAPQVDYVVTVPGVQGAWVAFAAELFMAALLMLTVLFTGNNPRLAPSTTWLVGALIACYVLIFGPVSGFSINPARTTASALFAHRWTAVWIYFTAPVVGMLAAAEIFRRFASSHPAPKGVRHFLSNRHLQQPHDAEQETSPPHA